MSFFLAATEDYYSFKDLGIELVQIDVGIRVDKYLKKVIEKECRDEGIDVLDVDMNLDVFVDSQEARTDL